MIQHDIDISKIAFVTVVLSVMISVISILLFEINPTYLPLKIGIIYSIIGLFWYFYDKYLWKINFFRLFGWLSSVPDLNGRWEGTVKRIDEEEPHKFVVEFKQTYTKLKYYVYTQNSKGESISAKFIKDEIEGKYKLVSSWKSKTKNRIDQTIYDEFYGMSIMDYSEYEGKKKLDDLYFTNRNPQTRGETIIYFKDKIRRGKF